METPIYDPAPGVIPFHPFRPIVGNATFCSDCPRGSSYGQTAPWHSRHEAVPLDVASRALDAIPADVLYAYMARFGDAHARDHRFLRSYGDEATCFTCGGPGTARDEA